jgi:hypothetical protein
MNHIVRRYLMLRRTTFCSPATCWRIATGLPALRSNQERRAETCRD